MTTTPAPAPAPALPERLAAFLAQTYDAPTPLAVVLVDDHVIIVPDDADLVPIRVEPFTRARSAGWSIIGQAFARDLHRAFTHGTVVALEATAPSL